MQLNSFFLSFVPIEAIHFGMVLLAHKSGGRQPNQNISYITTLTNCTKQHIICVCYINAAEKKFIKNLRMPLRSAWLQRQSENRARWNKHSITAGQRSKSQIHEPMHKFKVRSNEHNINTYCDNNEFTVIVSFFLSFSDRFLFFLPSNDVNEKFCVCVCMFNWFVSLYLNVGLKI